MISQAQDILRAWKELQPSFVLSTSGSTGEPKPIKHSRDALQWSAESTLKLWFQPSAAPIQLCVLPLNRAGGFMQVVRSAVWQKPLWLLSAQTNPFLNLQESVLLIPSDSADHPIQFLPYSVERWLEFKPTTVSLTPMQVTLIMENPETASFLSDFATILLGGQALSAQTEATLIHRYPDTRFIHTFGTTETASHFAGRELTPANSDYCIAPGTQISVNENNELQVCNPTTNHEWITLADQVQITAPNRFRWLQRSNLFINTGGIKVAIEPLENRIAELLQWPPFSFYLAAQPHPVFGEQITLFTTHNTPNEIIQQGLSALTKIEQPKKIIRILEIPTLANGKIYRNPNP
jgi:O-succinylbenzoic acid--CoA ligase